MILANAGSPPPAWKRIFEFGWLLAAVLVPIAVNPWGHSPFVPLKVAVLRTIVFGLVLAWALRALIPDRASRMTPRTNPLVAPALCLIAVETAATVLAVNPSFSLWGSLERGQGLLTLICYPLVGLIVASQMTGVHQARRLISAVQLAAVPILLIAAVQFAGWDFGLVTDARSPIVSTLGRPNFVAAYLAMLMPLTLVWAATATGRCRLGWGVLLATETAVLTLTRVRAGWLSALVGLTVVLALWFRPRLAGWWRRPALRLAIVATGGASVAAAIVAARAIGSGAARLAIWQGSLRLLFERPFLGYGPEALLLVFPKVYPPELVYHQGREYLVDRAHTFPLDWSLTVGVLGLVAWLAVLWTVAALVLGRLRDSPRDADREVILIASLAAVAANLAGNLIGFDVTSTSTLTWLLLGTMTALAVPREPFAAKPLGARGGWRRSVLCVVGIGFGLAILLFNLRPVVADIWIRRADTLVHSHPAAAERAAQRAVQWWPREAQYFLRLAAAAEHNARTGSSDDEVDLRVTEGALKHAITLQPQRFDLWLELGRLYARWPGPLPNQETVEQAHAAFREAVQRAPQHAVVYGSWGGLLLAEGKLHPALEMFSKAVDLDATDLAAWINLGQIQLALGRIPEARFSFERAHAIAPRLVPPLIGLAESAFRMGDTDAASAAIEQALAIEPENEAALALEDKIRKGPPDAS